MEVTLHVYDLTQGIARRVANAARGGPRGGVAYGDMRGREGVLLWRGDPTRCPWAHSLRNSAQDGCGPSRPTHARLPPSLSGAHAHLAALSAFHFHRTPQVLDDRVGSIARKGVAR